MRIPHYLLGASVLLTSHMVKYATSQNMLPKMNSIDVSWAFERDPEGWETGPPTDAGAEIYAAAGELRGGVTHKDPHIDSPPLFLDITEGHYLVLRMRVEGQSSIGRVALQSGASVPLTNTTFGIADTTVDFMISTNRGFRIYYVPIGNHFTGKLIRLRIYPEIANQYSGPAEPGHTFAIDWIRIAKEPIIRRVEGCINQYFLDADVDTSMAISNITSNTNVINEELTWFTTNFYGMQLPFATTYNCLIRGGNTLTITGSYFGLANAVVTIGGNRCTNLTHKIPEEQVTCVLPPGRSGFAKVILKNGRLPGLYDEKEYLSYTNLQTRPQNVFVSNVAARSLDVSWDPPGPYWEALSVTGYVVECSSTDPTASKPVARVTVGNVTTTTVMDLDPSTDYACRVAGVVEDQYFSTEWQSLDQYGRRSLVEGYAQGPFSTATAAVATLSKDFQITSFSARKLLSTGQSYSVGTHGPTGNGMGEGYYGLTVVGDAQIKNCNSSSICCDGYDPSAANLNCDTVCRVSGGHRSAYPYVNDTSRRGVLNNFVEGTNYNDVPASGSTPAPTPPVKYWSVVAEGYDPARHEPTAACGDTLRLTSSHARLSGAVWYPRKQNVREGFDTTFSFQLHTPSLYCKFMDDVHTTCRSRGGDGFAFVIQNLSPIALGAAGMGLGYGGIQNSVAIEFDTWYNYELLDYYENHISVQTRGFRYQNSPDHSYSLGQTSKIPDLTDGTHTVRIAYVPYFKEEILDDISFQTNAYQTQFFVNADYPNGGLGDWGTGVGTLQIYVDDLFSPVMSIAINLDATLQLDHGRAWVGFTAATGDLVYQTHEILSWDFESLRLDPPSTPPPIVNGENAFRCSDNANPGTCVHP